MAVTRQKYFDTLGIDQSDKVGRRSALDRAYQQRSFEIELYWRRGTYFWAFQGAILVALGLSARGACVESSYWGNPLTVALAVLGVLSAIACSLAARGSKFWQENWERHVDMLEDTIEGRLYKTVWLHRETVSFSVSGVNVALSDCFIGFWLLVAAYAIWRFLGSYLPVLPWLPIPDPRAEWVIIVIVLTMAGVWWCWKRTNIRGAIPNDKGELGNLPWSQPCWCRRWCQAKRHQIVRRYAPDEDCAEG